MTNVFCDSEDQALTSAMASLHAFGPTPHLSVRNYSNYQNARKTNRSCFDVEPQAQGENSCSATGLTSSRIGNGVNQCG